MGAEPGTTCEISYQFDGIGPPPDEGDFLRTRTGRCYKIERSVASRCRPGRYRLVCTRLGLDAVEPDAEGVYSLIWHPRDRQHAR